MLNQRGFTLIELLIALAIVTKIIIILTGIMMIVSMGNFWFTEEGVLRELRADHSEIKELVETHRNVFSYSVITVKNDDNSISIYRLNTDIFFNYSFHL